LDGDRLGAPLKRRTLVFEEQMKTRVLLVVILYSFSLSCISQRGNPDYLSGTYYQRIIVPVLNQLKSGEVDSALTQFYPTQINEQNGKKLSELSGHLMACDTINDLLFHEGNHDLMAEIRRSKYIDPNDNDYYHIWFYSAELSIQDKVLWIHSSVISGRKNLYIYDIDFSMQEHSITEKGKVQILELSIAKIIMILISLGIICMTVMAFYYVLKLEFKKKVLWIIFLIFGFLFRVYIPLSIENIFYEPALLTAPIVYLYKTGYFESYLVSVSFPLGLLITWSRIVKIRKNKN